MPTVGEYKTALVFVKFDMKIEIDLHVNVQNKKNRKKNTRSHNDSFEKQPK